MKSIRRFAVILAIFMTAIAFTSCQNSSSSSGPTIDITGKIYYNTGSYGTVDRIEFFVEGGTAPYKIYYSKSIQNADYAWSGRSYMGILAEYDSTYTIKVESNSYVSVGWYYHVWAVDANGYKGHAVWHP